MIKRICVIVIFAVSMCLLILNGCSPSVKKQTQEKNNPEVKTAAITVDSIDKFIDYVHQDLSAKYQLTKTTAEGDPIIHTLDYDGTTIKYTYDNTKDKFAGNGKGVITKEYRNIYKEGDLCYLLSDDGSKSIFPLLNPR